MRIYRSSAVALIIGLAAAIVASRTPFGGAGDLGWPLCGARALWAGADPYSCARMAFGKNWPTNPLTTILAVLPFAWLPDRVAGATIFGIGSAVMAYGLIREGQYWRLLAFASAPFWIAAYFVQWAPLLCGVALIPALLPLTAIKPHIGLPIALSSRWPRPALIAACLFVLLTFLLMAAWPLRWLATLDGYPGVIPLLTPAGLALLLGVPRWREWRVRRLLLMACVPQQVAYDSLILLTLPETPRAMLLCVACSWLAGVFWWQSAGQAIGWIVALLYLPHLIHLFAANRLPPRARYPRPGSRADRP